MFGEGCLSFRFRLCLALVRFGILASEFGARDLMFRAVTDHRFRFCRACGRWFGAWGRGSTRNIGTKP